jgi:NitT/TauT family transport system substrate-binding protein
MTILPAGRFRFAMGAVLALLIACAPNEARTRTPENAAGPSSAPPPVAAATATPRDAVRVSYSSVDASQIPVWVAQDAGFFEAQGLDVELVFIESGSKALQTLLAGEAPLGAIGAAAVIAAVAGGAELSIVASLADRYPYKLLAAPSIQRPADLRGRRLGVSRFGSSSDMATRAALKLAGLNPDGDAQLLQIGGDVQRTAALQAGAIDAAVLNPPATTVVRKAGFVELIDLSLLPEADYQHNTAVASRAYAAARPDVVQRYVSGLVQGIHYASQQKDATTRIISHYNQLEDAEGLDEAYFQYYAPGAAMVSRAPYPKPQALAVTIEEVAADRPDARRLRYEDLVDDRFVRALEANGLIAQLYGGE